MDLNRPRIRCSVIATTYNQPVELAIFLRSLLAQSCTDFEVLIADDGSGPDTRKTIAELAPLFGGRLHHVWHEDEGYRKSRIVNLAVLRSSGPWLVFVDADVFVHSRFIEDHLSQRAESTLFMGRRVDLNRTASDWIRGYPQKLFSTEFYFRLLQSSLRVDQDGRRSRNVNRGFRITSEWIRRLGRYDRVPDLLGSNFSICRKLFEAVNGFDESLEHYWGEDGDLFLRCRNSGARIVGKKCFAVQFHLWHPQREPSKGAEAEYQRKIREDFSTRRCANGLFKTAGT